MPLIVFTILIEVKKKIKKYLVYVIIPTIMDIIMILKFVLLEK